MQEETIAVIPAVNAADNDTRVQESEAHPVDILVPEPKQRGPKTHERAGITKNHNRGQSKQRRKMAAVSRRRNRSRA